MLTTLQAGTVIDLAEVPWAALGIAFTAFLAFLEIRLIKAGFVRQPELDGMARRVDEKLAQMDREREAATSMVIMVRDDLDGTRERTTRLEGQHESLSTRLVDSLKPLPGIESTLRELLVSQGRLATEIENLKRGRNGGT